MSWGVVWVVVDGWIWLDGCVFIWLDLNFKFLDCVWLVNDWFWVNVVYVVGGRYDGYWV